MVSLNLSLTENKALNQDGITALRSLSLVQGQTYDVSVSLYSGVSQVAPTIANFSFVLSDNRGASLVSQHTVSPNGSGYLFSLPLVSPAIGFSPTYSGSFSFDANGTLEIIEPFNVSIASSAYNENTAGYVSSLNNLTSDVIIAGGGSISVTQSGQTIIISGGGSSGSYYPLGSNPSGYISSIPSDVVRTSGNQTIAGQKTFSALALFLSGASGVFYGDGSHLTGIAGGSAVLLTTDQTVSGVKTFADGLSTNAINDETQTLAIDLATKSLVGKWILDETSAPIVAGWTATETLSVVTDGSDATPATVSISGISWGSANDGDTVTVTINGTTITFTFRNSPSGPDDVQIASGDDAGTGQHFNDAINTQFSGSFAFWTGLLTITTAPTTGAGQSISVSGSINGNAISVSGNGSDAVSPSGTRIVSPALPVASNRTLYITEVFAYCTAGSAWAVADIEIGYGTSDDDFQRALVIPQAFITPGMHSLHIDVNPTNDADAGIFFDGVQGAGIIVREASGGSAASETTGADVHIYLRGLYY